MIIYKGIEEIFSPIIRSQGNNIVSATTSKAITETHVAENAIRIITRGELKRLQQSPLQNGNNVNLYVTSANFQKAWISNNNKIPFYITV